MIHKGVEYTMTLAAPGVWNWQFRIGDKVRSGKTEARLQLLAMRRVQLRIDRELKKAEQEQAPGAEKSRHWLRTLPVIAAQATRFRRIGLICAGKPPHGEFDVAAGQLAPAFDLAHIGGLRVALEEVARPRPRRCPGAA